MKNKGILIFIVVVVILIIAGILISVLPKKDNDKSVKDKAYGNETDLSTKQCLDNGFCVGNFKISKNSDYYFVFIEAKNEGKETLTRPFVKIVFKVGNKEISSLFTVSEINVAEIVQVDFPFTDDADILKAKKYELRKPTDEEIKEYKEQMGIE